MLEEERYYLGAEEEGEEAVGREVLYWMRMEVIYPVDGLEVIENSGRLKMKRKSIDLENGEARMVMLMVKEKSGGE